MIGSSQITAIRIVYSSTPKASNREQDRKKDISLLAKEVKEMAKVITPKTKVVMDEEP
jgi:hypothetical protein